MNKKKFWFFNLDARRQATWKLLFEMIRHLGWKLWGVFFLVVVFGAVSLLPAALFRYFALNLSAPTSIHLAANLMVFGLLLAVSFLIASVGNNLCREWLGLKTEGLLRLRLLGQIHALPLDVLDNAQRGDWLTSMSRDIFSVEMFFMESIPGQLRELSLILGTAAVFFYYSGLLALIPLATALGLAYFNLHLQAKLSPYLKELRGLRGGLFQVMIESMEGVRTIRSHRSERSIEARFSSKFEETQTKTLHVARRVGLLAGTTDFLTKSLVAVCLCVDAWLFEKGKLSLQEAFIYPFYTGLFYDSVCRFAEKIYDWNLFFNESGRVAELIYHPEMLVKDTAESLTSTLVRRADTLRCDQMLVSHADQFLTKTFDFSLGKGAVLAVLGPSGCGKSTFLEHLAGLRPIRAEKIECFDEDGEVLWRSPSLFASLPVDFCAYVEQHPYLFEGTLRENLKLNAEQTVSDSAMREALERLGLDFFFKERKGLETRLLERGKNLSVGERYRVAFCRSLLLSRPFLLLDEPFAALDEESVKRVVGCLAGLRHQAGVVVVTHVLPEGFTPDKIVTFDNKEVTSDAQGSPRSALRGSDAGQISLLG